MNLHLDNPLLSRFLVSFRLSQPTADVEAEQTVIDKANAPETRSMWPRQAFDADEPSFFKKHSLLAAYIAFALVLCACLAAFAVVAIKGVPAIVAGL
jgi:hypothetical protein